MNEYVIERRGGLAGLPATGRVAADALDSQSRAALDRLIDSAAPLPPDPGADRYTYLVTRRTPAGETAREIPESLLPQSVTRLVRETI
ncbi:protealysin inhibitor emfourin [Mycobacterium sp. UM_Kg1]|uniref:protealysin inhibitor emfourin n=1 Tax=Mycobacterium sp. UM_Kg1 TaxID=1545691 RepID=UPI00061B50E9|nr:protealysin inhibitor emfourin [Mycobacterium sp. UM_Kg1]